MQCLDRLFNNMAYIWHNNWKAMDAYFSRYRNGKALSMVILDNNAIHSMVVHIE